MAQRIQNGTSVTIKDANGKAVLGKVVDYGQANDGTGRHGYWVKVGTNLYWRQRVRRS